jgi:exoribonuclease R
MVQCRRWRTTTIGSSKAHAPRREHGRVYRLGDKVKVQVIRVNMDVRQVDLALVEILEQCARED